MNFQSSLTPDGIQYLPRRENAIQSTRPFKRFWRSIVFKTDIQFKFTR